MSFGALSREAKVALALGASGAGTATCSGEGGMHPDERAAADRYVFEMASGYAGWTEQNIARADAIEVKIGQGAKPGLGGQLPGRKVTAEIAAVRGGEPGEAQHSPAHFPDITTLEQMRSRLDWIRGVAPGIPIGIKLVGGDVEADVRAALTAGADWITIDGMGGGTGAGPELVKGNVGIPSLYGLARARNELDRLGVNDVQLVVTGGLRTPDEVAKALALGADAVAMATAAMMAVGCQQYRACQVGSCPVGIATQRAELRQRLDVEHSGQRVASFLTGTAAAVADFARLCGHRGLAELNREDLIAFDRDLAERIGIPWVA
jgi:glutamate synthase domain-containing protein 2